MALSFASKDTMWLASLLSSFSELSTPVILSDNRAAVHISSDCGTRKNHRHIEREFRAINELVYSGKVCTNWIGTDRQLADIFTKALGWRKVLVFVAAMGLKWPSTLASNGGTVCGGSDEHTPPAIVRLLPGFDKPPG